MTSLATVIGLFPTALGLETGTEANQPLALAVVGGLTSSTLLSLFLVPVMFLLLREAARARARRGTRRGDRRRGAARRRAGEPLTAESRGSSSPSIARGHARGHRDAGPRVEALDAVVKLLHVVPPPDEMVGIVPGATPAGEQNVDVARALQVLDGWAEDMRAGGVRTMATEVTSGGPARAIIFDRARDANLVVMGSRWSSVLSALSTAASPSRSCGARDCPVLVVRGREHAAP